MDTQTTPTGDEILAELLARPQEPEADLREDAEEEPDLDKLKRRAPPSRGVCRRCGENKPVNRLMLCYPCWVKTNLEEQGWREGMPHPDWCRCEGLGGHSNRRSDGN